MAGEEVRLKSTIKSLEDELNLIKNQVQQTLLDIREHILDVTNPFNNATVLLADAKPGGGPGAAGAPGASGAQENKAAKEEPEKPLEEILPPEDKSAQQEVPGLPEDDVLAMDTDTSTQMVADAGPSVSVSAGDAGGGEAFEIEDEPEAEEEQEEEAAEEEAEPEEEEKAAGKEEETAEEEEEPETTEEVIEEVEEPDNAAGQGSWPPAAALRLDLVTLAALVRWVSVSMESLGRNRVEVVLDAYEAAGRINPQVKAVIKMLCALQDEEPDEPLPVREVLAALVRMEGVLGGEENGAAHRLMAILLDDEMEPLTRLGMRG